MKVRAHLTGEILNVIGFENLGGETYVCLENKMRKPLNEVSFLKSLEEYCDEQCDWRTFRREAAKAAMQGFLAGRHHAGIDAEGVVEEAIRCADALIAKLREEKK